MLTDDEPSTAQDLQGPGSLQDRADPGVSEALEVPTLPQGEQERGAESIFAASDASLGLQGSVPAPGVKRPYNRKVVHRLGGPTPTRGRGVISAKESEGEVVWAKAGNGIWWPAQVLSERGMGEEAPRLGAVPVRFFGSYARTWIESQRAVQHYDADFEAHADACRQEAFYVALEEAANFQMSGELPQGFSMPLHVSQQGPGDRFKKPPRKPPKVNLKDGGIRKLNRPGNRKLRMLAKLGLTPVRDSPYGTSICLDGIRALQALWQQHGTPPKPDPVSVPLKTGPETGHIQPDSLGDPVKPESLEEPAEGGLIGGPPAPGVERDVSKAEDMACEGEEATRLADVMEPQRLGAMLVQTGDFEGSQGGEAGLHAPQCGMPGVLPGRVVAEAVAPGSEPLIDDRTMHG